MKILMDDRELVIKIPWNVVQEYLEKQKEKKIEPQPLISNEPEIIEATRLSELLYALLSKRRKIERPNIKKWSHELLMLHKKARISFMEMEHGIYYSQNEKLTPDKYFPVIQSAEALRKKWNNLINYREKHGGSTESINAKLEGYQSIHSRDPW